VCTQTLLVTTIEPSKNNKNKFRKSSILKSVTMLMLTPLLTISSWALEKLLVAQQVHKYPAYEEFRRLITGSKYVLSSYWCGWFRGRYRLLQEYNYPLHFPDHVTSSPPAGDLKLSSIANSVEGKNFPLCRKKFPPCGKEMKIVLCEFGARVVYVAVNVRV